MSHAGSTNTASEQKSLKGVEAETISQQLEELKDDREGLNKTLAATKARLRVLNKDHQKLLSQFITKRQKDGFWPDWNILLDPANETRKLRVARSSELEKLVILDGVAGFTATKGLGRAAFVLGVRLCQEWPQFNALVLEGLTRILPYLPDIQPWYTIVRLESDQYDTDSDLQCRIGITATDKFYLVQHNQVIEAHESLARAVERAAELGLSYKTRKSMPTINPTLLG